MATFNGTTLNDTLFGSGLSDLLYGLAGNDSISGGSLGDDTLDGGTGSDTLDGGVGDDTYVVDSTKDVIIETGVDANDLVQASITIDLNSPIYSGVENVTLTGTGALNATGNDIGNVLIGNAGANKLDGRGGNDAMGGGAGNDTYEVDSDGDFILELSGGGTDQVNSSTTFTLSDFIENLTLTGSSDSDGTGNDLANKITGNSGRNDFDGGAGNDTLTGNDGADILDGGAGADSMTGGNDNDSYTVDDVGDKVVESSAAGGADTVFSTISYTLGTNLEDLFLLGAALTGTGNSLANTIIGSVGGENLSGLAGNDSLFGDNDTAGDVLLGGDGDDQLTAGGGGDTLVGGAGKDTVKFSPPFNGVDVIADFSVLLGDAIDVTGVLIGFTAGVSDVTKFVKTGTTADGSTTIQADLDGTAGGFAFKDLAVLQGVSTDLNGLIENGSLINLGLAPAAPTNGTTAGETLAGGTTSDLINGLGGNDTLTGDAGDDTLDGGIGADSLTGGAGNDLYVLDSASDKVSELGADLDDRIQASITIDLNNVAYAGIDHVTLTGTGALNATGNGGDNMLIGNAGANVLNGGGGVDTLIGGAGNDTYRVDGGDDQAIENPGEGTDTVIITGFGFTLGANIENLTLDPGAHEGNGNDLANKITGNVDNNSLNGFAGNDTLIGNDGSEDLRGGTGADSMVGGNGSDTYNVDDVGDKVSETSAAGGTEDGVVSSIDYTLGANIESLELTDTGAIDGTGNTLANEIQGNIGDNVLSGLAGADTLRGGGGADLLLGGDGDDVLVAADFEDTLAVGDDTLAGGAGADRFVFEEGPITGLDRIRDFNAPLGDVIDVTGVLVGFTAGVSDVKQFLKTTTTLDGSTTIQADLDGPAGVFLFKDLVVLEGVSTDIDGLIANGSLSSLGLAATPINGTTAGESKEGTAISDLINGLGGNDTLTGDGGADTLDGGTGTDSLTGGAGNDTYVIDSASDKVSELGIDLDDRIQASISIDLNAAAYANIEHVTLTGTGALHATGNTLDNMLIGNAGANILDGQVGNDTLIGGGGNDTYTVDSPSDVVIENPGEGTDQVNAAGGFSLGVDIENLTLTGSANISGEGNDLANKITGNTGDNQLLGGGGNDTLTDNGGNDFLEGGIGADSMSGGIGDDTYSVDSSADKVSETSASGGLDTVKSSITYTLGSNLENLTLADGLTIDGTGNSLNNSITGGDGDNVLSGLLGNDTLAGGDGDDQLLGGDGADLLRAGDGADILAGGAGSDRFAFDATSLGESDLITDFTSAPGGDILDVSDLLIGFDPNSSNINKFLQATVENGATFLQVDANGGGNSFVDLAVLVGVNTDVNGLLNNGSLVLAD